MSSKRDHHLIISRSPYYDDFAESGSPPPAAPVRYYRGQMPPGWGQEFGDAPNGEAAPPASTAMVPAVADLSSPQVEMAARALATPHKAESARIIDVVSASDPSVLRRAAAARAVRDAAAPTDILYIKTDGVRVISTSIGPNPVMRAADARAAEVTVQQTASFEPQVFPAPIVGPVRRLDIDSALAVPNGGPLAVGTPFAWVGEIWRVTASVLNATPGTPFTIFKQLGPTTTMSMVLEVARATQWVGFLCCHGVLRGGLPRITIPQVTVQAVASGDFYVTNDLNPGTYESRLRFLQAGDREVDGFLRIVE